MTGVLRRQNVPNAVVWTWKGTTDFLEHEVRCHTDRLGVTYYTLWIGNDPTPGEDTGTTGLEQAEALVNGMREHGADCLKANRLLTARGYDATEHTDRPDCNCMTCDAVRGGWDVEACSYEQWMSTR